MRPGYHDSVAHSWMSSQPMKKMKAERKEAQSGGQTTEIRVESCAAAFNHTGDVFAVGTSACKIFLWKLDLDVLRESDDASPLEKAVKRISISRNASERRRVRELFTAAIYYCPHRRMDKLEYGHRIDDAPSWVLQTTLTTPEDAAALREQQRMAWQCTSQQYSRRSPKVPNMHIAVWSSVAFSSHRSMGDQSIRVWDVASGTLQHAMREHTAATYVIQPNPGSASGDERELRR